MKRSGKIATKAMAAVAALSLLQVAPSSAAPEPTAPRLRLGATSTEVVARRYGHRPVRLNVGMFLAALDADLDLRIQRASYDDPLTIDQVLHGSDSEQTRPLPPDIMDSWFGLKDFTLIEVRNAAGEMVRSQMRSFCPNGYERQRVDDSGPINPTYPDGCWANPFTVGFVWGIDRGWATNPFGYSGSAIRFPGAGEYDVTFSISPTYQDLFGVAPTDASVHVHVTVKQVKRRRHRGCRDKFCGTARRSGALAPEQGVPTMDDPDPSILPDLQSLPSWGIRVDNRSSGQSYLSFGANVWVGGASSLVVEGFRRSGEDIMDGYQYFYANGEPVGRSQVGTLEYDDHRGHRHWHFRQFARYSLLGADQTELVRSKKEAFCLAPTDPIDLSLSGATRRPDSIGLHTACGGAEAIWIRETLPLGWGDTYFQGMRGQSFKITDLPNGTYYIEVAANPDGVLHEQSLDNNSSLREVILKGRPGHRRVEVPPYHGIDTEGRDGGF